MAVWDRTCCLISYGNVRYLEPKFCFVYYNVSHFVDIRYLNGLSFNTLVVFRNDLTNSDKVGYILYTGNYGYSSKRF